MKKHILNLLVIGCAMGLLGTSLAANAYQCKWVQAHYVNGKYVSAHKVCYQNKYTRYRHCGWRNGHKVCWN